MHTKSDDVVSLLLEAGASTDIQDNQGRTPIHIVTLEADMHYLEPLLEGGASASVLDGHDQSPLMMTCEDTAYTEATDLLLAYDADPN